MKKNNFNEVEYPNPDIEYWVVFNELEELPHYFKTESNARAYAKHHKQTIIFKECFN